MPKVLCTLPNASDNINGVKFVSHEKGMLSEDVGDDVADNFALIPGYVVVDTPKKMSDVDTAAEDAARREAAERATAASAAAAEAERIATEEAAAKKAKEAADAAQAEAAERAALEARATAVGFVVKGNWGLPRLKSEVEVAEKAAAEKLAAEAAGETK